MIKINIEKSKKKGKFSKRIIVFMLLFLFFYTLANLFIFYKTGAEPSTLTMSVFAFFSAEGWYLSNIKKLKGKEENKNE